MHGHTEGKLYAYINSIVMLRQKLDSKARPRNQRPGLYEILGVLSNNSDDEKQFSWFLNKSTVFAFLKRPRVGVCINFIWQYGASECTRVERAACLCIRSSGGGNGYSAITASINMSAHRCNITLE